MAAVRVAQLGADLLDHGVNGLPGHGTMVRRGRTRRIGADYGFRCGTPAALAPPGSSGTPASRARRLRKSAPSGRCVPPGIKSTEKERTNIGLEGRMAKLAQRHLLDLANALSS